MPTPHFKKGNKFQRGSPRPRAGRKTDYFKSECDRLVSSPYFFDWASDVFAGKDVEPHFFEGKIFFMPASVSSRVYLWKELAGYARGKPVSILEMKNETGQTVIPSVVFLPATEFREGIKTRREESAGKNK